MSTQTQWRRGTHAQMAAFAGSVGEIVYDSTQKRLVAQDGATLGGSPHALLSDIQGQSALWKTVGGTANVITLTSTNAVGTLQAGVSGLFTASATTTSRTVTINLDGLGAGNVKVLNANPAIGAIANGATYLVVYDGTSWQLIALPSVLLSLLLGGSTSGTVTLTVQATAGTYTLTLPNTAGTQGFMPQTDGAGNLNWVSGTQVLAYLKGANLNAGGDQAFTIAGSGTLPAKFRITEILATNPTGQQPTAVIGAIYTGANRTGTTVTDPNNPVYANLNAALALNDLPFNLGASELAYNNAAFYLNVTTLQLAASGCDIYLIGYPLP